MNYAEFLETVEDVDGMLTEKSHQLGDCLVPEQRKIVMEQVDTLLDLRNALGAIAVESATVEAL